MHLVQLFITRTDALYNDIIILVLILILIISWLFLGIVIGWYGNNRCISQTFYFRGQIGTPSYPDWVGCLFKHSVHNGCSGHNGRTSDGGVLFSSRCNFVQRGCKISANLCVFLSRIYLLLVYSLTVQPQNWQISGWTKLRFISNKREHKIFK